MSDFWYGGGPEAQLQSGPATITGDATLTGAGSLAAAALAFVLAASPIAGSGNLAAAGLAIVPAATQMSGAGSLSASGVAFHVETGAVAMSGAGSLSASALNHVLASAPIGGAGTLAASGLSQVLAASQLSGSGTLASSGLDHVLASAPIGGSGSLSAQGLAQVQASASLPGVGSLSAQGLTHVLAASPISGSGALVASGLSHVLASVTLPGAGTLVASGEAFPPGVEIVEGATHMSASGTLSASGFATTFGSTAISGSGSLVATIPSEISGRARRRPPTPKKQTVYREVVSGDARAYARASLIANATVSIEGSASARSKSTTRAAGIAITYGESPLVGVSTLSAHDAVAFATHVGSARLEAGSAELLAHGVRIPVVYAQGSAEGRARLGAYGWRFPLNLYPDALASDEEVLAAVLHIAARRPRGWRTIHAVADDELPRMRRVVRTATKIARKHVDLAKLTQALEQNDQNLMERALLPASAEMERTLLASLPYAMQRVVVKAGQASAAQARSAGTLRSAEFDPDQPRDKSGKWTSGDGGGGISSDEEKTLSRYSSELGNSTRRAMYDVLAGDPIKTRDQREAKKVLDTISKLPPHQGTLVRGMAVGDNQMREWSGASEIEIRIPSSWSEDENVALDFGEFTSIYKNQPNIVLFEVSSKSRHVSVNQFLTKGNKWLRESVNLPNTRYKIVDRREESRSWTNKHGSSRSAKVVTFKLEELT